MKKSIQILLVIIFALAINKKLSAQTVETGHEIARGEFNFAALADSYAAHPPVLVEKEPENEEDEPHPLRPAITNPALIHGFLPTFAPGVPLALSPAPTDTFESTLDNGSDIPPDTHGAVDSNYCMTTINPNVRIQTRAGGAVSLVSLDAFFTSVLPGGGTFDPRCYYDIATHRWIVVADAGGETANSALLIAISKTSNPTGAWWTYKITTYAGGADWLDYPDVGFNSKWITITGNLFPVTGSGYDGCKVFVFDKASLLSGAGAPYTAFTQSTSECICPAVTYDAAQTSLFCLESWDGTSTGGGILQLWKITGAVGSEAMTSVGFPASLGTNWQGQSNAVSGTGGADFAPQLGTASKIQTNDDRIFQVVFMNNKLWTAHNVFLPYSTTANPTRCSIQWWQVDTLGTPDQIGLIDDPTNANFYSFPNIAVNTLDDALVGYTNFSAAIHPSAAYSMHLHTDATSTMETNYIYRHGQNTYFKNFGAARDRWGDYSGTCIDPLNQINFWTIQEASAPAVNTWDTWWAFVKPCNPPGAIITPASSTAICSGASVVLNANTGTGYTYQWQLGGANIAGATGSSFTASAAGTYNVIVTVVTCFDTSAATVVTVNPLPTATITPVGSTILCTGGTVGLNANTGAGLSYQWQLGGTPIAGATASSWSAVSSGNYTVIVTNSFGCSTTSGVTVVTVGVSPTSTITAAGPTTFCSGNSVVLNATSGAGLTYQWNVGGSPIAGATSSSYTATTGGSYTVMVTNLSGCNATSGATVVVVNPTPAAITGTLTVCAGATTPLFDGTSGGTWTSTNPAAATISGSGVVTGIGTGGVSTISYTLTGCAATAVVTVNSISVAAISGSSAVCAGQSITLSDVTPGGTWSSSAPAIATVGTSGIVNGMTPGSATITYAVSGGCGTASVTKVITVSTATVVSAITGTTSVCAGVSTPLSDVTPAGVWSTNNPAIAAITPAGVVTAVASGIDTIKYSVTNLAGCVSTVTVNFTVFSSFSATATASGPTSFCTGADVVINASSGIAYQWSKNGTAIAGATTSSYTASTTGNYTVLVTATGGCTSVSSAISVSVNPLPVIAPSVAITATAGPVYCNATSPTTFSAVPTYGGTAPTYQWFVNGAATGTLPTFSYTPTVGDIVKVTLTSNATCAFPLTASHTDTMVVSPLQTPSVVITASPAEICAGTAITFIANPVYGGSAPTYRWEKNGINVATGYAYVYIPSYGDILKVTLFSNYQCLTVDSAISPAFTVHTINPTANTISVIVTQSGIVAGSIDTFVAIAPNAGTTPHYQWLRNGVAIAGATSTEYVTDSLAAGQVISCEETSSTPCATPDIAISGGITVKVIPVGVRLLSSGGDNFTLIPNPNKGEFTIKGTLANSVITKTDIVVTDMLGQAIYKETTDTKGGKLNTHITLDPAIANGSYLVTITNNGNQVVYHLVISK